MAFNEKFVEAYDVRLNYKIREIKKTPTYSHTAHKDLLIVYQLDLKCQ
jgi:hypothetical protein